MNNKKIKNIFNLDDIIVIFIIITKIKKILKKEYNYQDNGKNDTEEKNNNDQYNHIHVSGL